MFSKEELTVPGSGPAWIRVLHTVYTEIPGRQGWPGSLGLRVNPKPDGVGIRFYLLHKKVASISKLKLTVPIHAYQDSLYWLIIYIICFKNGNL